MKNTQLHALSRFAALISWFSLGLVACTDDGGDEAGDETGDETGDEAGLELVGEYMDDFGTEHSIREDEWMVGSSVFALLEYDNAQMWAIARNDLGNEFFPGLYSRFDWVWDGDQLYYCQSAFDAMTAEDAKAQSADPSDLQTGCGMFPWSQLNPQ